MWRPFVLTLVIVLCPELALRRAVAQQADSGPPSLPVAGEETFDAIARFYDYDPSIPLQPRVLERTNGDTSIREKIVFRGVRGFLASGYFEAPQKSGRPMPLVLLLHGWSGSKDSWWQDGGYISGGDMRKALLKAGYAVLALDAPTHGDRIAENDYALVNDLRDEGRPNHRNYFTLSEIVVQGTRDYRRALDYVQTREEIDPKRVGVIGYSMGALQTFILTAVEPRIRVSVACAVPSLAGESTSIAPQDYARGSGDRPFLMLMGREDKMGHPQHAGQLFELIPSVEKDLILFDAGHKLPVDYVTDATAWFDAHLK